MEDTSRHNSATDTSPAETLADEEALTVETEKGKQSKADGSFQPAIIRAEANMLRWPVFANGTKGLSTLDGFEVLGSKADGGNSEEYLYRCTRNTDDMYPGDLSRRIHHALLAKLEKQGFPYQDSVEFSWRELAGLMNRAWKGQSKPKYKAAIRSTHGLRIRSVLALKQKTSYCDVKTRKEHSQVEAIGDREEGFSIYSSYVFQGDTLEDGSVCDVNRVTFSPWIINNLNSFYYAKIDRQLWIELDAVGPIASRLYEYLLFSRSGDWNKLRIRYERLCMFLPATVMKKESEAKRQFDDAIEALRRLKVISRAAWSRNASGELLIEFYYGDKVRTTKTPSDAVHTAEEDGYEVRVLTNSRSPQAELVSAFYGVWNDNPHHRPYQKELDYARDVIEDYSLEVALEMVPHVEALMREDFPGAKTFNATKAFWEDAVGRYEKAKATDRIKKQQLREKNREERRSAKRQQAFDAAEQEVLALSPEDRQRLSEATQASMPPDRYAITRKLDTMLLKAEVDYYMKHFKATLDC